MTAIAETRSWLAAASHGASELCGDITSPVTLGLKSADSVNPENALIRTARKIKRCLIFIGRAQRHGTSARYRTIRRCGSRLSTQMQCSTLPCCCNEKTNAAIDTAEAAAQGRGKACRNAVHQLGAPAERGVQHAGPSTRCTGVIARIDAVKVRTR
jgi:hypothetical protein